jgi:alpha-beta hydrolase superfamily lysophospholipase
MILTWALCTCRLEAQVGQEGIGKTDRMQVCHGGSIGAVLVLALPQQLLAVFEELLHCQLDILSGVAYLPQDCAQPVVLVGHSFGGAVVIAAGAVTPQVAGVVALAPRT